MVLPLIVRAAPFFAKGAAALKKGKKLKDMGMADVVDAPILRIAGEAAKKSKGTSVASKAATAAVGAAALADAASTPKPKAEAKGRRGGVAPSGSTARENAAPKITPKAAPKTEKKMLGGREVKNGKVFVSKAELDAFKKKYGTDKTLRDLLNKERGLTRRADKPKAALKPIQTLPQFRAEQDKMAAKKKALQAKAREETGKKK
jgi:hypothetical protein